MAKAVTGPPRPTRADLDAARDRTIPDVIAPGLRVVFAGINPGLYSAATGYHFARPGNRFWPALHRSGFTERVLRPDEQERLLGLGLGITNIVARAAARADELRPEEFLAGARILNAKIEANALRRISAQVQVRTEYNKIGSQVLAQTCERVCCQGVGLRQGKIGFHPRNVLTGNREQFFSCSDFRSQHLG